MAVNKGEDKRRTVRILSLNLVSYSQFSNEGLIEETAMGRTLDLSLGGIKLEVTNRYPLSSDIELNLQLHEQVITVKGRVVYVEELKNGKVGLGIKFSHLDDKTRKAIEHYLAK
jgi:c-di-GMP-binding flagellar brake protein YcgR